MMHVFKRVDPMLVSQIVYTYICHVNMCMYVCMCVRACVCVCVCVCEHGFMRNVFGTVS
jgi:hypothetical protein